MLIYIARRLILLPITLFFIVLVNFVIANLAPGEPVNIAQISQQGASMQESGSIATDNRYLTFREFYGLTLPILFNTWPFTSMEEVHQTLWQLVNRKEAPNGEEMSTKDYNDLKVAFGDQAKFIMGKLLDIAQNKEEKADMRSMAIRFFIRGGTRQAILGPGLDEDQRRYNKKVGIDNNFLNRLNTYEEPKNSRKVK